MVRIISYVVAFLLCLAIFGKVRFHRVRQATLLLASYTLYFTWGAWFAAILFGSTVVNYLVGEWLRRKRSGLTLSIGILLNLALLGTFKYLPGISLHLPFSSLQRFEHLALPLGISFWTFQAMSYLFDIYQGEEINPTFFEFALYMVFFPITISGPVCRMPEMLPQFRSEDPLRWDNTARGFQRIATGVLMMQLAKLLGQGILAGDSINSGFDRVTQWSGPDVWCLAAGYGLQLFFDFAGYSHIAIGAAQVLGITIPENFARPFGSTSPSMFWTRWHMSLSFWIRDYVFFPLMQMRREVWWRNLCFLISMTLFGLWHKGSLLFLIWGAYHGLLLVLHRQVQQWEQKLYWDPPARFWSPFSWITTFTLISLGWIFFRAGSLPQARQMLSSIASPASYSSHFLSSSLYLLIAFLAAGYAVVVMASGVLSRYTSEPGAPPVEPQSGMVAMLARSRWFWIPPLYALVLLLVFLITSNQGGGAAQLMYRSF